MSTLSSNISAEQDEIIEISSAPITSVLCYTMSLAKKYALIGTQNGFCIVDNAKKTFIRF